MKNIGKPCAGKPHARFDEGGLGKTCPLLYPLVFHVDATPLVFHNKWFFHLRSTPLWLGLRRRASTATKMSQNFLTRPIAWGTDANFGCGGPRLNQTLKFFQSVPAKSIRSAVGMKVSSSLTGAPRRQVVNLRNSRISSSKALRNSQRSSGSFRGSTPGKFFVHHSSEKLSPERSMFGRNYVHMILQENMNSLSFLMR